MKLRMKRKSKRSETQRYIKRFDCETKFISWKHLRRKRKRKGWEAGGSRKVKRMKTTGRKQKMGA